MEVPKESAPTPRDDRRVKLLDVMDRADRWYRAQLREHPERARAIEYLKGRGVDGAIAKRFGVGYAPPGYHNLLEALGGGETMKALLVEAGLLATGDGTREPYDRFRDRILFPIRDGRGRTIAFGGRVLGDGKPKYLNSPETPLFHKGRELYGLYECRQATRDPERVLLVEGYMDVVGLAQAGVPEVCASLGTAATRDHLGKLFRLAPEVVFCFDGDAAGARAAWKAVDTALEMLEDGVSVRLLFLPDGEDPDSLIRSEGQAAFRARLAKAVPLSEHLFDALGEDLALDSIDGRSRLAHRARPMIDRIPGAVMRSLMMRRLAELTRLPVEELERIMISAREAAEVAKAPPALPPEPASRDDGPPPDAYDGPPPDDGDGPPDPDYASSDRRPAPPRTPSRVRRSKEETALAMLLRRPTVAADVDAERLRVLGALERPGVRLLCELLERLHEEPTLAAAALIAERTGTPEHPVLRELAALDLPAAADPATTFAEVLVRLEAEAADQRRRALFARVRSGEADAGELEEYWAMKRRAAGVPPPDDGAARPGGATDAGSA
jgi:DNA primase